MANNAYRPKKPKRSYGARPLADLIGKTMAPVVRKRGFANLDLIANWPELVGSDYAETTQPDKIVWPRLKNADGEDQFAPATLHIRVSGKQALFLQHEIPLILERLNVFFGYAAIGQIRLIQKPLQKLYTPHRYEPPTLTPRQEVKLNKLTDGVEDDRLRAALTRLGKEIIANKSQ